MFSTHASSQIAADRRARAMHDAEVERTAGWLKRLRRHAPPVALPRPARGPQRQAEAA
jgi:hypothetical protein